LSTLPESPATVFATVGVKKTPEIASRAKKNLENQISRARDQVTKVCEGLSHQSVSQVTQSLGVESSESGSQAVRAEGA
jgi:hypothetical protein